MSMQEIEKIREDIEDVNSKIKGLKTLNRGAKKEIVRLSKETFLKSKPFTGIEAIYLNIIDPMTIVQSSSQRYHGHYFFLDIPEKTGKQWDEILHPAISECFPGKVNITDYMVMGRLRELQNIPDGYDYHQHIWVIYIHFTNVKQAAEELGLQFNLGQIESFIEDYKEAFVIFSAITKEAKHGQR